MARAGAIVLALLATAGVVPAAELCRVRSKALVVRDVCKPREQALGPAERFELGMGGRPGARGPHGPATNDLRVLDADGDEVGVVAATGYYGTATAVARLTLPGSADPEFVLADVDGQGLSPSSTCEDLGVVYRTADCLGEALAQCFASQCDPAETRFARPIFREDASTACYTGDPSAMETGNYYRRARILVSTPAEATATCQSLGGTLFGPLTPCRRSLLCGRCCRPISGVTVVPLHYFDASLVGTPPFRLAR